MTDDARLLLLEASDSDSCLGMAQVDKSNNSFLILRQVCLSEKAVVVAYGCAFVDDTEAFQSSNVGCVDEGLTLGVRRVGRDSQHDILCCHFVLHVELVKLLEVEGKDLFDRENVRVPSLQNFEADFVICHRHNFVRHKLLLKLKLRVALSVQTKETCGEKDAILEISLDLRLD